MVERSHELIRISPSEITTYLSCPAKYFFRYVLKLQKPKSREAVFGLAMDAALSFQYEIAIKAEVPPHEDVVEGTFEENLKNLSQSQSELSHREIAEDLDIGIAGLRQYRRTIFPHTSPVSVQESVSLDLEHESGKVQLVGYIDLLEKKQVTDFKTTSRTLEDFRYQDVIQLVGYALSKNHNVMALHVIPRTKNPNPAILRREINSNDVKLFMKTLEHVIHGIQQLVFFPNRGSLTCRRRYCPFWRECEEQFGGRVED